MSATTPAVQHISPTSVFHKRDFSLLWVAMLVNTAGSALTDLAAGIYVFEKTHSTLLVGATLMAAAVPSLVVGLIAGVFVDRLDRKKIMVWSALIQAVVVALIPFLIGIHVAFLFVALLFNSGVKQFFDPAYNAVIPEVASDEELEAANAFLSIASFGTTAIGFAGAGLLASININFAFWIDSLTFLFAAGAIMLLRVKSSGEVSGDTSIRAVIDNLGSGVATIVQTPMLRSLFLLGAPVFFAFGLWNVLLLPMAIRELHGSDFEYGLQEGLTSVGFVVGSLFMAKYSDRLPTGLWVFVGCFGMGISGILYGLSPFISVAIVFVVISGFFNSPSAVARSTLMQRYTPREMRGRVFSSNAVMRDVVFLVGMAGAGIADIVGVRELLIVSAVILIVVSAAALVAPGVGRPAAEWRHALAALRAAPTGAVHAARPATMADFEVLVGHLATFTRLSGPQRAAFIGSAQVRDVPAGARVITRGELATSAYFILDGDAAAGIPEADGGYRGLSTMTSGDFFGEIGALTGSARTADVVVTRPTTLLEVPADALRGAMEVPEVQRLINDTLAERLLRSNQPDLPRLSSMDQDALRDLRTPAPKADDPQQAA